MKKIVLIALSLVVAVTSVALAAKKKKKKKASTATEAIAAKEIKWMTWAEAQQAMAKQPKKVYVDVFTDWCGWCKVMDKKTFTNPNVIKYMNENFYAIKFNAEKDDNIVFNGKVYGLEEGTSKLAKELMKDKMMYPTSIIFEENFANPQPIAGYLDIKDIQPILTYLGGNVYRQGISYDDYKKDCKITW